MVRGSLETDEAEQISRELLMHVFAYYAKKVK
jgi:hypothetical protein